MLANVDGRPVPIPINRTTINALYGLDLDEAGVAAFLDRVAEPRAEIRTSEDVIVSRVGRELYERFFAGYTRKHWGPRRGAVSMLEQRMRPHPDAHERR